MKVIVGIDASRSRSGGATAHLIGILKESNPTEFGIVKLHIWSYKKHLNNLPDYEWIIKHNPPELENSLLIQLWWQYFKFPKELKRAQCDIVLNLDAGSICPFHPSITMSRDMLSFEEGEMKRFNLGFSKLRLLVLKYVQIYSLKRSDGAVFLTKYASEIIQKYTGKLKNYKLIPHGVSNSFKQETDGGNWNNDERGEIKCLYVSNVALYKHQWEVVKAISILRKKNYAVSILFAGGGTGPAQKKFELELNIVDPDRNFTTQIEFVNHNEVPRLLSETDIFIFASSCENMPNTLLEAMSGGLPIACSNRGPMPEVLLDGGEYFNPEDAMSIADAIETLLKEKELRIRKATKAKLLAEQYSWERCGKETWEYLVETLKTISK